ncbi:septum site-determining protein MinC [Hydrogenophaga atypica]|uniref:Probable septum site-determining protein MinC n=1 Tax=Hydrogenophaga atypica TaxID=249409 RepID=A0ABW2QI47_9BURK
MTVALAANAPTLFDIKSAQLPLVALRVKTDRLDQVADELAAQYADVPDFFDNDALLIDFSQLDTGHSTDPTPMAFEALLQAARSLRLRPVAVRGGGTVHAQLAEQAGLVVTDEVLPAKTTAITPTPSPSVAAAPAPTPVEPPAVAPSALVIDKPLRSGQQVYARGRDLVVLAMVNPGAEVIADGHIHVYAPLRGKAIAGARGNTEARIFALAMEPELVSIAGIYRTSEVPWPDEVLGKPTQVRLFSGPDGDKLVMDAIKP